nr:lipid A-modifier LpxR family protein [Microbulbifer rhizosphaerae]
MRPVPKDGGKYPEIPAGTGAVFHDITLDGNTWKDSHSVQRNPLVADLGVGVAASYGKWKFAFARYLRSREFEEQAELPQLGSLAVWREL